RPVGIKPSSQLHKFCHSGEDHQGHQHRIAQVKHGRSPQCTLPQYSEPFGERYSAVNFAGNQSRQKYETFSSREKAKALPSEFLNEGFRQVVDCHHHKAKTTKEID